jgi:hypothetical protein
VQRSPSRCRGVLTLEQAPKHRRRARGPTKASAAGKVWRVPASEGEGGAFGRGTSCSVARYLVAREGDILPPRPGRRPLRCGVIGSLGSHSCDPWRCVPPRHRGLLSSRHGVRLLTSLVGMTGISKIMQRSKQQGRNSPSPNNSPEGSFQVRRCPVPRVSSWGHLDRNSWRVWLVWGLPG